MLSPLNEPFPTSTKTLFKSKPYFLRADLSFNLKVKKLK